MDPPRYAALQAQVKALNIEGAVVLGDTLRLLQRGNGAAGVNAFVDVKLACVLDALDGGTPVPASALTRVVPLQLGKLDGVALGLTDACALDDGRILFAAAAEDTDSTYADGRCTGSVLGVADRSGRVTALQRVQGTLKIEGVSVERVHEGRAHVLLVADGDDPTRPAPLLSATLDLG